MLHSAIEDATPERLCTVLHFLCDTSHEAQQLVCSKVLVSHSEEEQEQARHRRKRCMCVQCERELHVLKNSDKACVWHDDTPHITLLSLSYQVEHILM
jgi:hypothetical protein